MGRSLSSGESVENHKCTGIQINGRSCNCAERWLKLASYFAEIRDIHLQRGRQVHVRSYGDRESNPHPDLLEGNILGAKLARHSSRI